jgi:Tol biopolymer transport system component
MALHPMALVSGTKLGPYEVQCAIGAGGMGEVYRARDTRLNRTVAVKILPVHLSTDFAARQRFDREARVISSLNHPNICQLYDVGSQDGVNFTVMEFLEGETLADRLKKGPLPLEQVLKCGIEICEGLEKAHKSGVVHRDLKPGNIMLTKSGAKLMDFGLAKAMETVKAATATATVGMGGDGSPLTAQGTVVGTFQYMAPEQVEGKEADTRSDVFALGAVLYEMATGQRAFEGKTTASVIAAVLERNPAPVSAMQPASPPAFDCLVKACLAKDPDERFQSIHDLKLELRSIAEVRLHAGGITPAATSKWRERLLAAAALLFAAIAAGLGYAYLRGTVYDPPEVHSSILPPENESFLNGSPGAGFALSNDGTRLAFFAQAVEGKIGLWVRPLNSRAAHEVAPDEAGMFPFWSPDGRWVAFFADGKLKKVPSSGGAVQVICDAPLGRGGAWNSQGEIVFAPSQFGPLYRVPASGGVAAPVTMLDTSLGENTHRWPDFLPDGRHFLYLARQLADMQPAAVYLGSLESASRRKIIDSLTEARYASPGYLVFARKATLFVQQFNSGHLSLEGGAVPLVQDAGMQGGVGRSGFTVSQVGHLVYASSKAAVDVELIVMDRSGKRLSSLETTGIPASVRVSPDGHKLAVSESEPVSGTSAIWISDLSTGSRSKFTFAGGQNSIPVWSPDGSQLALSSSRTGTFKTYVKPVTGAEEEQPLNPTGTDDERVQSWSPDGRYIVFDSRPQSRLGLPQIAVLPLTGDRKPSIYLDATHMNAQGQVSPDGHWLAYTANESGRMEVYVSSFPHPKGKWQVSFTGGQFPRWRGDGRELFYCRTDGALMVVQVSARKDSFTVGSSTQVAERRIYQPLVSAPYDVSPDGQRIIMPAVKPLPVHAPLTLVTNWTAELKK